MWEAEAHLSMLVLRAALSVCIVVCILQPHPPTPTPCSKLETGDKTLLSWVHSLQDLDGRRWQESCLQPFSTFLLVFSLLPGLGDAWIWGFLSRVVPCHMSFVGVRLMLCYSLWPTTQKSLTYPSMGIMAVKQGPRTLSTVTPFWHLCFKVHT